MREPPAKHAPPPCRVPPLDPSCSQVVGQHAQKALFEGGLAALLASASRGLFAPDMASEHIEYARNILVRCDNPYS